MKTEISTDLRRLDVEMIHKFLSTESYWAKGIPLDTVRRSIRNSLCFGVYLEAKQVGFARVITDKATFAYLADVFILPEYRGQGLSKQLMEEIMSYPELRGLRRWLLATADAHSLYQQYGFQEIPDPRKLMGIKNDDVYAHPTAEKGEQVQNT